MYAFRIKGGKPIHGTITPQGSKNEAFMVINASLLAKGKTTIYNIPDILDISVLIEMLEYIGVGITQCDNSGYTFDTSKIEISAIETAEFETLFKRIRGGMTIVGPLLARFGKVSIYKPGGDKIGRRKIDTHLLGLQQLGAEISYEPENSKYTLRCNRLTGADILLEEASVTGTANIVMAAALAHGKTTIYNAACEPHIQQLCHMAANMGAKISGIGSNLLTIHGVDELMPTTHTVKADMLEVGSFIALGAMTASDIRIKNCGIDQLAPVLNTFRKLGIHFHTEDDDIVVNQRHEPCKIDTTTSNGLLTIYDAPWPGFPADLISAALVVATQCCGTVLIHQKMFESRLFFVDSLIEMGAQIVLCDPHRATVVGLGRGIPLSPTTMSSPDIRAGMALLIAALSAQGTSIIKNIDQIDRGYSSIDTRLKSLGADVERIRI